MSSYHWHGLAMFFAWVVLVPLGIVTARFFKVLPSQDWPRRLDHQFWWRAHRLCQYGALALTCFGLAMVLQDGLWLELNHLHAQLGIVVIVVLALQILSGWLRGSKGGPTDSNADPQNPATWRGDHYDMTERRLWFEAWHKSVGYAALILAWIAIWFGLELLSWSGLWLLVPSAGFLAVFVHFERTGRRIDTWEAIWGPRRDRASRIDHSITQRETKR